MAYNNNSEVEEYYQKLIQLQERLRKSEEERLHLEMKYNEMIQVSNEEEQLYYKRLKSQYKFFAEENQKRKERNEKILRTLERLESSAAIMESKSKRLGMLRYQYHAFLQRREREWQMITQHSGSFPNATKIKVNASLAGNIDSPRSVEESLDSVRLLSRIKQQPNAEDVIAEEIIQSIYERKQRRQQAQIRELLNKSHTQSSHQLQNESDDDDDDSTTESAGPLNMQRHMSPKQVVPSKVNKVKDIDQEKIPENSLDLNQNTVVNFVNKDNSPEGLPQQKVVEDSSQTHSGKSVHFKEKCINSEGSENLIENTLTSVHPPNTKEIIQEEDNCQSSINDHEQIIEETSQVVVMQDQNEKEQSEMAGNPNLLQDGRPKEELQMYYNNADVSKFDETNAVGYYGASQDYYNNVIMSNQGAHSQEYIPQDQVYYDNSNNVGNIAEGMPGMYYSVQTDVAGQESTNVEGTLENLEQPSTSDQIYYQADNYDQIQYDENGQLVYQQKYDNQNYEQYGYDENGQLITYQEIIENQNCEAEEASGQFPECTNYVDNLESEPLELTGHADKHAPQCAGSVIGDFDVTDQAIYSGIGEQDANVIVSEDKGEEGLMLANVIELLDTDIESDSHAQLGGTMNEAEVLGNDSDFNFSSTSESLLQSNDKK